MSIIIALAALVGILLTSACNKEPAAPLTAAAAEGLGTAKAGPRIPSRTFDIVSGEAFCRTPPQNCIHGVTITPVHKSRMGSIIDALLLGRDADIRAMFKADRALLLNYLNTTDVDDVIAGKRIARSTTLPEPAGLRFILVQSTAPGNPLVVAYGLDLK